MPIRNIITKLARNPPTLTTPFAAPRLRIGLKVRAKSKPISEPGPPTPMTTSRSITTARAVAGPARAAGRAQATPMAATMPSTRLRAAERIAGGQDPEDRPGHDSGADEEQQQLRRGLLVVAEAEDEEREAPEQAEDRARRLGHEVRPEAELRARAAVNDSRELTDGDPDVRRAVLVGGSGRAVPQGDERREPARARRPWPQTRRPASSP